MNDFRLCPIDFLVPAREMAMFEEAMRQAILCNAVSTREPWWCYRHECNPHCTHCSSLAVSFLGLNGLPSLWSLEMRPRY
mmetsp:Transcript_5196/g.9895  ORF Transcript_5196/g.9895 Transcript_5196/m.9895 type:complete len:80 (+) Transcript_5196:93-332(+)